MRADAHYVDQLTSRREVVHTDAPRPPKRLETVEAPVGDRDRRELREADPPARDRDRAGREPRPEWLVGRLLDEVATIQASAALLAADPAPLTRRANVDAIRAHAWRVAGLLAAQAIVDGSHRTQVRPRQIGALLTQIRDGFAPECRLTGLDLQVSTADWNAPTAVDDFAMIAAASSAVHASVAFLPDPVGATVRIAATTLGGELRTLDVVQEHAPVTAAVSALFFDPGWVDRPGGSPAALAAACIRAVAALHGGEAVFMAGARRGSTIRINLAAGR